MAWTLELAHYLANAPWPCTKQELIDYAIRTNCPSEVIENCMALEDDEEKIYESIRDVWPDYPTEEDFLYDPSEF